MKSQIYVSPNDQSQLKLSITSQSDGNVISGHLTGSEGQKFHIENGVPNLIYPPELNEVQQEQLNYYQTMAEVYDDVQKLTFQIQREDEKKVRQKMVDELKLTPNHKVLEIACGTGLDSISIAQQLNEDGELYVQDISIEMLKQCQKKLVNVKPHVEFVAGNGSFLPFPDQYFDRIFSFGGFNVFEDPQKSLKEMVRVLKPGGRIVFGDESMPPWLLETEFAQILLKSNPLFKYELPLKLLPVEARNVSVQWVIGGVYYLISFDVAEGPPQADFDLPIPGRRGGTLRTRFYGQLEGVTPQIREKVFKAAQESGLSVHDWLNKSLEGVLSQTESIQNV